MIRLILLFFLFLFSCEQLNCLELEDQDSFFHATVDHFCEKKVRQYGDLEKRIFVIAAYIIRSFLATQRESYISLQVNLCQLRLRLCALVKNIYQEKKKKDYLAYSAFKQGLICTGVVYYLLTYFSRYYSEECEDAFIQTYMEDSFIYTFLYDTFLDVDFDLYDEGRLDFRIREKKDEVLNLEYPSRMSFALLGMLCLHVPKGMCPSVHSNVRKLINRVFAAHSGDAYMEISPEDLCID